jgi:ATP-dependent Lhr-like helicase
MSSPADLLAEPILHSLWRMGWTNLRPLQEQSIRAILQGDSDLILAARTASGKTEAAFLPILSRICDQPLGSIRAIYVGPLKALINDQFRRLEELCEYAEIPVHKWHGDVSGSKKHKVFDRPGGVLLITPESLESLFVNRNSRLAQAFHSLSFVVIDELHSLLGTERGSQLRSQLFRLGRYTPSKFRIVGLSATIGDLPAAARWMRPDNPAQVQILKDDSNSKTVRYRIHSYLEILRQRPDSEIPEAEWPASLFKDIYEGLRGSKNLVFANSKSIVEELTDRLNELGRQHGTGEEFLIHHGSLSREIREDTERLMQESRPYTTVCTSTLELGIDIGNVTSVGQVGPCHSVSSLVQRLGRSGRRDDEAHQMRVFIVAQKTDERSPLVNRLHPPLLQAIAMTELLQERWVESPDITPFDLSTLLQQTLSYITETGGTTAATLFDTLISKGAFRFIAAQQFATFLRGLHQHDLIEQHPDGTLILGLAGERLVRNYEFYAAFEASPEYRIIAGDRVIGKLPKDQIPPVSDHLLLAGKRWQVMSVDHDRAEALVRPAAGRKPPGFTGGDREIAPEIRRKMQAILRQQSMPAYIDSLSAQLLTSARIEATTSGLTERDIVRTSEGHLLWFPWTGSRAIRTMVLLLEYANVACDIDKSELSIEFRKPPTEIRDSLANLLSRIPPAEILAEQAANLERRKWDSLISRELLIASYAADALDVATAQQYLVRLEADLRAIKP